MREPEDADEGGNDMLDDGLPVIRLLVDGYEEEGGGCR